MAPGVRGAEAVSLVHSRWPVPTGWVTDGAASPAVCCGPARDAGKALAGEVPLSVTVEGGRQAGSARGRHFGTFCQKRTHKATSRKGDGQRTASQEMYARLGVVL